MNLLESVFCYLHHERLKANQSLSNDTTTGNIIVSLSIIMYLFGFFYLLMVISPDLADSFEDVLKDIFGRSAGKLIGQLLVIVLLIIIYPIVKMRVGSQNNFDRIKSDFLKMSKTEQAAFAQKGKLFFIGSVVLMMGAIFLKMIVG